MPDPVGRRTRRLVIATGHALSLALIDDGQVLASHHEAIGLGHAEALMPALAAMLAPLGDADAGIAAVVVEVGPGSFTGLRIGHAAASGLALAWGVPLLGVRSTLMVAAEVAAAGIAGTVGVALAAPRGQLWIERFDLPALRSLGPPEAVEAADFPALAAEGRWAGSGAGTRADDGSPGQPRAAMIAQLDPALFQPAIPLYVRTGDATGPG